MTPLKFRLDFFALENPGLSHGFVCVCLAVLVQYRRVTGERTDRQTHDDSIYRASIVSHDKKYDVR